MTTLDNTMEATSNDSLSSSLSSPSRHADTLNGMNVDPPPPRRARSPRRVPMYLHRYNSRSRLRYVAPTYPTISGSETTPRSEAITDARSQDVNRENRENGSLDNPSSFNATCPVEKPPRRMFQMNTLLSETEQQEAYLLYLQKRSRKSNHNSNQNDNNINQNDKNSVADVSDNNTLSNSKTTTRRTDTLMAKKERLQQMRGHSSCRESLKEEDEEHMKQQQEEDLKVLQPQPQNVQARPQEESEFQITRAVVSDIVQEKVCPPTASSRPPLYTSSFSSNTARPTTTSFPSFLDDEEKEDPVDTSTPPVPPSIPQQDYSTLVFEEPQSPTPLPPTNSCQVSRLPPIPESSYDDDDYNKNHYKNYHHHHHSKMAHTSFDTCSTATTSCADNSSHSDASPSPLQVYVERTRYRTVVPVRVFLEDSTTQHGVCAHYDRFDSTCCNAHEERQYQALYAAATDPSTTAQRLKPSLPYLLL